MGAVANERWIEFCARGGRRGDRGTNVSDVNRGGEERLNNFLHPLHPPWNLIDTKEGELVCGCSSKVNIKKVRIRHVRRWKGKRGLVDVRKTNVYYTLNWVVSIVVLLLFLGMMFLRNIWAGWISKEIGVGTNGANGETWSEANVGYLLEALKQSHQRFSIFLHKMEERKGMHESECRLIKSSNNSLSLFKVFNFIFEQHKTKILLLHSFSVSGKQLTWPGRALRRRITDRKLNGRMDQLTR